MPNLQVLVIFDEGNKNIKLLQLAGILYIEQFPFEGEIMK